MTWPETYAAVAALDVAPAVRDCLREALTHAGMAGARPPDELRPDVELSHGGEHWETSRSVVNARWYGRRSYAVIMAFTDHCEVSAAGTLGSLRFGPKAAGLWVAARLKELEGTA